MQLSTSAFLAGGDIPAKFTCDGSDLSPALVWTTPPDGFREFLIEELGIAGQAFFDFIPILSDGRRVAYLPCPCGSGKHSRRCHLEVINKLISKIGRSELRSCVDWIVEAEAKRQAEALKAPLLT